MRTLSQAWEVAREGGSNSQSPHAWDGLVGDWPLLEGNGNYTYDLAGAGNDLAGVNSPPWTMTEDWGPGIRLNGSSQFLAPIVASQNTQNLKGGLAVPLPALTICLECIWDVAPSAQQTPISLSQVTANANHYYRIRSNGGQHSMQASTPGGVVAFNSGLVISAGQPYSLAAAFEPGNLTFYVDGNLERTSTGNYAVIDQDYMSIGARVLGSTFAVRDHWHEGVIASCSVYSRLLTPDEVSERHDNYWARYTKRPTQVAVPAVNDITGTNAFGSSGVTFSWTVNP